MSQTKRAIGKAASEQLQAFGRIAAAEALLDIGDLDPGVAGHAPGGGETLGEGRHAGDRLQRVLRAHHPPDLVEIQLAERLERDVEMAAMGGIEGAAQYADPPRHAPNLSPHLPGRAV